MTAATAACGGDEDKGQDYNPLIDDPKEEQPQTPDNPVTQSGYDEQYRPQIHFTPAKNWINDPNGMVYQDGTYHLFYQYNPQGNDWGNMSWGHATSTDLMHWTEQAVALTRDALGAVFSGSCVIDKNNTAGFGANAMVALYTAAGETGDVAGKQQQSIAYSTDGGKNFTRFANNPVIKNDDDNLRDPKVFWHEGSKQWIMALAKGWKMGVEFYGSADLKSWKHLSTFVVPLKGRPSLQWECPDLFELEVRSEEVGVNSNLKSQTSNLKSKKWVLICNINPGGPFGGSATQYFVGSFDGHKFTCESMPKVTKWLDYGKDHYATVSFYNAPENRRVVLAWMSNWQYANQVPTKQFRSANSIPRDLGLFTCGEETYLSAVPSKEMLAMRGAKVKKPTEACEIVVDLNNQAEIVLSNTMGEQVVMTYDAAKQKFTMDRTKSGNVSFSESFPCVTEAPTYGQVKQLRLFIDRCSIEAFDAAGKMTMTNLVFPSEPYNNIKVKGGKATIYEIK